MLFLDDVRSPKDCLHYMGARIGDPTIYNKNWIVVSNYDEFARVVTDHYKEITHVSFDHDLGEDVALEAIERGMSKTQARQKLKKNVKSGYDCAEFLKMFYKQVNQELPVMFIHSMNPVGTQRIINLFKP